MQYVTLANGVKMPILGYGVYQVSNEECERCVLDAISVGYRSIDTAQAYHNEEAVGSAIEKCGVPRDELFLTTKVWISNAGYERAKASIDASLKKLRTDYIDLLLIHQPFGDYYGTWRAMEEAYRAGKLRAIGVSNFYPDRLVDLCKFVVIKPMVNQVETHVFQQQKRHANGWTSTASPMRAGVPSPKEERTSSPMPSSARSVRIIRSLPRRSRSDFSSSAA